MYAIIATGGKQYKVEEGDVIKVEKLGLEAGSEVTFDQVLLVVTKMSNLVLQLLTELLSKHL